VLFNDIERTTVVNYGDDDEIGKIPSGLIKGREFLDQLDRCQLRGVYHNTVSP
jgi:hypothetical protein